MGYCIDERVVEEGRMVSSNILKFTFRKLIRIRTDAKTVSIMSLGCFHPVVKVQSASVHFFLGDEDEEKNDSDDEEEEVRLTY